MNSIFPFCSLSYPEPAKMGPCIMNVIGRKFRWVLWLAADLCFTVLSLWLAFQLRFEGSIPNEQIPILYDLIPIVLICRGITFLGFGFYSRFWEYSGWEDLVQILKAGFTGSALILFWVFFYNRAFLVSRSVLFMELILVVAFLCASRLIWKILKERETRNARL